MRVRLGRPTIGRILVSLLILGLGFTSARALSQVDEDLRIMHAEYTLAAADLAHIMADVMRYRNTIIRALEARSQQQFEQMTASLPEQRARIHHEVDRYASASLRVSRSGRSEPEDLQPVRDSLDAYFSTASRTINLLLQEWTARSPKEAVEFRRQAELHAADNAGPKVIQISLAIERLLETVMEVSQDMREEGTQTIRLTSASLIFGSLVIAALNLVAARPASTPSPSPQTQPEGASRLARPLDPRHPLERD